MNFERSQYPIASVIIFALTISIASAQPPPPPHNYGPECWRGSDALAGYNEARIDSGFIAFTYIGHNERGYPMRSSNIIGVSDTTTISVRFEKRRGSAYDISTVNPETWFTPVLYAPGMDRRVMPPVGDTTNFHCQFLFWTTANGTQRVAKPSAIPPILSGNKVYYLKYAVWGIPQGRYLLTMKTTAYAPTALKLCMNVDTPVWISDAVDLQDTLSAYAGCFWRAIEADSFNIAKSWTDTILALNPYSLIGYRARAHAFQMLNQVPACLAAFDSVLAIAARYGDPVLPDSSDLDMWQRKWHTYYKMEAAFQRWCVDNRKFLSY